MHDNDFNSHILHSEVSRNIGSSQVTFPYICQSMLEQRLFNFYTFIVLETYNSVNVGYVFTVFSGGLVSLSGNKYFRISVQLQLLRFLSLNHFSHLDNARQCRATS